MTVADCLRQSGLAKLEAQMLLAHVLGQSRVWLIAHDTDTVTAVQAAEFNKLCMARTEGQPMAYLIGRREFMDLDLEVNPSVLIPRPETELLVQLVVDHLQGVDRPTRMLDLGTGSGAIALAVANACPNTRVSATDISGSALAVAHRNAQRLELDVDFFQGSWFEPFELMPERPEFDVIASNPPYIRAGDHHLTKGDLRFEPVSALTDGSDGLSAYRIISAQAKVFLKSGGCLWFEHGFDQSQAVQSILLDQGFDSPKTLQDLAGLPRVTGAFYNAYK